jgi:hypothetical protein
MTLIKTIAMAAAAASLFAATGAQAHAHLLSSTPADKATVASPKELTLTFSEKLQPKFSGLKLTMPDMNNMVMATKVKIAKDGMTMIATPTAPLPPGAYAASWYAVTADTHRMQGQITFTVK